MEEIMRNKINVGIVGYGNLGRGVELALGQNEDFELKAIFSRREPSKLNSHSKMVHISKIQDYKGEIDVMILCGGSATDLPEQGPEIAAHFNTVDSFDNHGRIPEYFEKIDEIAREHGHVSLISTGWDPGLFSLNRLLGEVVLPEGESYTFWGKGLSQGHSDAVRRVPGVIDGVQYTIPIEEAIERVRLGENPQLSAREKHKRVCYVVAAEDADKGEIEKAIVHMPNYFADYDTEVNFITQEELEKNHSGMPHGGFVIRSGQSAVGSKQRVEFALKLNSNPEFTASVIVAFTRGVYKLSKEGKTGALSVFDIPFGYLSPKSAHELRKELL